MTMRPAVLPITNEQKVLDIEEADMLAGTHFVSCRCRLLPSCYGVHRSFRLHLHMHLLHLPVLALQVSSLFQAHFVQI